MPKIPIDLKEIKRAAKNGEAEAQYQLGMSYLFGRGLDENAKLAYKWLKKAADQNHVEALYRMGSAFCWFFHNQVGTPKKYNFPQEPMEWFRRAAELGHSQAKYALADFCLDEEQMDQGIYWLRQAAEDGIASAQYRLGELYAKGKGVPQDQQQAFHWYSLAAEQGHNDAQSALGECYFFGWGVEQDEQQVIKWHYKVCEGDKRGYETYYLARRLAGGSGLPQNQEEAFRLFQMAAVRGCSVAYREIADCYLHGKGVQPDPLEATKWLLKWAQKEKDNGHQLYNIGQLFEKGDGGIQDWIQAIKLYRRAARAGHSQAEEKLGECYYYGLGVPKNVKKAAIWYRKAADHEYDGLYLLAQRYEKGEGIAADQKVAEELYRQAFSLYQQGAEKGDFNDFNSLGELYHCGRGVVQDEKVALVYYIKAAKMRGDYGWHDLGDRFATGDGITQDYRQAAKYYRRAGKKGLAAAIWSLGILYWKGLGVQQDRAEAFKLFHSIEDRSSRSFDSGNALHFWLGECYLCGIGVTPDPAKALQHYKQAADSYYPAALRLGDCYYYGIGVERDYAQAFWWYLEAVEYGKLYRDIRDDRDQTLGQACFRIGQCYELGQGVHTSPREANQWYTKAATQGLAKAQEKLSWCYKAGYGVRQDQSQADLWHRQAAAQEAAHVANRWQRELIDRFYDIRTRAEVPESALDDLRQAAHQGDADAQNTLRFLCLDGLYVPTDGNQAWY